MSKTWIEKGQVWRSSSGTRVVVDSNPNEFNRIDIHDEKTGARSRVHTEFLNGKKLVEQLAKIPCEERSFA